MDGQHRNPLADDPTPRAISDVLRDPFGISATIAKTPLDEAFVDDGHVVTGRYDGRRHRSPESGPLDANRILSAGDPELLLIDYAYEHAIDTVAAASCRDDFTFVLLYDDGVAQLWGKRSVFDDPDGPEHAVTTFAARAEAAR